MPRLKHRHAAGRRPAGSPPAGDPPPESPNQPAEPRPGGDPPPGPLSRRSYLDARIVFLAGLCVVAAVYTWLALDMEWRTAAGRIGPGFFPRIVGGVTVVLCCVAIVRLLVGRGPAEEQPAGEAQRDGDTRYALLVAATVVALVGYLLLLEPVGALIASALFLFALLVLINRGHLVLNLVVSLLLPTGLYLLFEVLLNAGLPEGPLSFL